MSPEALCNRIHYLTAAQQQLEEAIKNIELAYAREALLSAGWTTEGELIVALDQRVQELDSHINTYQSLL